MALTQKQKAAIADQARKNIAKRAATQRTKISASEARTVSSKMNKRPGAMKGFTLKDSSLLSKNEKNILGRTSKANAAKEKFLQKNRNFAKGTGKLAVKDRVGTKSEYKQLGKDIEMRKQLIARSKVARASQAARAANPAPAKATTLTKAVTPVATKKTTATPKVKASTAAVKKRTVPNTNKPKIVTKNDALSFSAKGKTQTPQARKLKGAQDKVTKTKKLQTLEQAKASAPKPISTLKKPASMEYMSKTPASALSKPAGKVSSKVNAAKKAAASTKVGNAVKAVSKTTAAKSVASKALSVGSKLGKSKLVKGAGLVAKVATVAGIVKEANQIKTGQSEKDFRRIQALENRVAAAKGEKPKYTRSGSNRNLAESLKVDAGNALSFVGLGKSRKDRLAELKNMAAKAEKKKLTKPAPKPSATKDTPASKSISGNKYRVNAGDTLSGIASRAGVSLKDLRSANPQITDPRKIYRNTGVVIPKGGKVPTGGYTKKAK